MFKNSGEKIKMLANIFTVIGCIVYSVLAVMWISENVRMVAENGELVISIGGFLLEILRAIFRVFLVWFIGLLLYAFGDLVEDIAIIRDNTRNSREYGYKLQHIADEFEKSRKR